MGGSTTSVVKGGKAVTCDKPVLLTMDADSPRGEGQCVPFSRVGKIEGDAVGGDALTEWAFFCRRYYTRSESSRLFDDVNMIGYNPNTGATCFFNSWLGRPQAVARTNGDTTTTIPNPDAPNAYTFWMPPEPIRFNPKYHKSNALARPGATTTQSVANVNCSRCHDSDAWIVSPFVKQASRVPTRKYDGATEEPYFAVHFDDAYPQWRKSYLSSPKAEACTECHRIGAKQSCQSFTAYSVGNSEAQFSAYLSPEFAYKKWMPPGSARPDAAAVAEILRCCGNVGDATCQWRPMPRR